MATLALSETSFGDLATKPGLILIDFWAAWCGPCRIFKPIFEAASERHPGVTFATVDTEAEQQLAAVFGIQSIPTLVVIRDGVLLLQQAGALPEHVLDELVEKALSLDMNEVQRAIVEGQNGDDV
jgi:thioredoxin 1